MRSAGRICAHCVYPSKPRKLPERPLTSPPQTMEKRRLTASLWAQVRARWQGSPDTGHGWLAAEVRQLWHVEVSRQAVQIRAHREGWVKGGLPATLQLPEMASCTQAAASHAASSETATEGPPAQQSTMNRGQQHQQHEQQRPQTQIHGSCSGDASQKAQVVSERGSSVDPSGSTKRRSVPEGRANTGSGQHPSTHPKKPWIPAPINASTVVRYRPEFADELILFFSIDALDTLVSAKDGGGGRCVPARFPTFERFATNIGVSAQSLRNWATKQDTAGNYQHPEFASAYARAKDMQTALVIEGGMSGVWADRFALLAAKNLAGWKEKVEIADAQQAVSRAELERIFVTGLAVARERQAEVVRARLLARGVLPA
jgi:hypothetical protein